MKINPQSLTSFKTPYLLKQLMEAFTIFTSSATVDPIISNNKEIGQYFSRSLTEFKDFSRRLLKFKTFSKLYEPSSQMANFHAQNQAEQQLITKIHRTAVREMFLDQELVIIICQGVLLTLIVFLVHTNTLSTCLPT